MLKRSNTVEVTGVRWREIALYSWDKQVRFAYYMNYDTSKNKTDLAPVRCRFAFSFPIDIINDSILNLNIILSDVEKWHRVQVERPYKSRLSFPIFQKLLVPIPSNRFPRLCRSFPFYSRFFVRKQEIYISSWQSVSERLEYVSCRVLEKYPDEFEAMYYIKFWCEVRNDILIYLVPKCRSKTAERPWI